MVLGFIYTSLSEGLDPPGAFTTRIVKPGEMTPSLLTPSSCDCDRLLISLTIPDWMIPTEVGDRGGEAWLLLLLSRPLLIWLLPSIAIRS